MYVLRELNIGKDNVDIFFFNLILFLSNHFSAS